MTETFLKNLFRRATGVGTISLVQKALSLIIAVGLARALGVEGYGYYAFAMAVVRFAAIPTQLGLPWLVTREIAAAHAKHQWGLLKGVRRKALRLSIVASVGSTIAVGAVVLGFADHFGALDKSTFGVALFLLPVFVLVAVTSSILRGLRQILHALWPASVLVPLLFLALLLLVSLKEMLSSMTAVLANLGASILGLLLSIFLIKRFWPAKAQVASPDHAVDNWRRSLVSFSFLAGINVINQKADILMLGFFTEASDVGVYNVVVQAALLVSFSLAAFNSVLGPNIARLYAVEDKAAMQRMITLSSIGMAFVAGLTAIVLLIFGEWLLGTIFGGQFVTGYKPLAILVLGQLGNVIMGSVGLILAMTGYENETVKAMALSALLNVVLNFLLIPLHGMTGAAIASAASIVLWNILLGIRVYQKLELMPGAIGVIQLIRRP